MPKPKKKVNKVVRAWAVIDLTGEYGQPLTHWENKSGEIEQYEIFLSKREAQISKNIWVENVGGGTKEFKVVPVEIKILK